MKNNPKAKQHPVINCPPPPAHTKEEWKVFEDIRGVNVVDSNGDMIAGIWDRNEMKEQRANAQRIVKAVNMHDELIVCIKSFLIGIPQETWRWMPESVKNDAEQLLKQAEQK